VFEILLAADGQHEVLGSSAISDEARAAEVRAEAELLEEVQHHFIRFFLPALLGYSRPPYSAAASRRALASFGLVLGGRSTGSIGALTSRGRPPNRPERPGPALEMAHARLQAVLDQP
jgi:hypothetical protein